jgi:MFS family permease
MSNVQPTSLLRGKRFFIILFLFFNIVINYIDRVNLSIAAPVISKYFHWDAATMGWVFSAYLWTYTALLVHTGWLGDRIGVRRTAAISISVWSVAAMLTGAVTNFFWMILARLGLGVGESATFPMCNNVVRQWFPAEERGFATGLSLSQHSPSHSGGGMDGAALRLACILLHLRVAWFCVADLLAEMVSSPGNLLVAAGR